MISVLLLAFSGPNDPPAKCFRTNEFGDLPTCTYSGGEWVRSYPSSGFGPGPGGGGGFEGVFVLFFVVALVAGVAGTVWKVSTARRMARESGMSERDATAMSLLSDDGFEATYLASNLRGRPTTPIPAATPGRSTADRLRELDKLRAEGLVSDEEHETARRSILEEL
ncbi:hypothetical protein BKA08_003072 [Nocardioides marinisabuli]|uniref:SHOCT domain-containing protein n=1 Tax=Nocardioides marinisabuli TaxID=419476 RepID=A0A7Y9F3F2_9ACTN|nr:SHOCT domain-containing protein [Nocardioides marinisabuli]NYD58834.1 hypothetical protein [Nocardioides marinisabuli]